MEFYDSALHFLFCLCEKVSFNEKGKKSLFIDFPLCLDEA